ncbi:zf-HC2 domain-containing protein [Streptomyces sp. DSM 44915]|uniref:Zf-HC2 domain-containing protein n=1 Tax=Streptomyces chisholmiae TaxID=3075540 RepID=A0ABU2JT95_9ACTN|nr:zf-HC2 domain-containing protein [Streptomyces sp. DSM 44915]MDT0268216.1 zf-HC2 domain-containing protein [Streptomyces sp. DSM 44915]
MGDGSRESGQPGGPDAHQRVTALLGAWALAACSTGEARLVEEHLDACAGCAAEALRLRDAAMLLEPRRSLDLDPELRAEVLDGCLARRPARLPVPSWAAPLDAEAARLDALLHDMADEEWRTEVRLRWYDEETEREHPTTVPGVLAHLLASDGLLARTMGLPDPLAELPGLADADDPVVRAHAVWARDAGSPPADPRAGWEPWRAQTRALVWAAARTGGRMGERRVAGSGHEPSGLPAVGDALSLSDLYLDRAFACWVHAGDIAEAVEYPYDPPLRPHLRLLVDLAARRLPGSIAGRRRAGLARSSPRLTTAGSPGRTLHLEVEGAGGGDWFIPLDSPVAGVSRTAARAAVAHVALDDVVFCQLAAGRIAPDEAASGTEGDPAIIHDVLAAAAALSRL